MGASFIDVGSKSAARERWEALPEDTPAELIDDRIVFWAPGTFPHSLAMGSLGSELMGPFQFGRNGGPGGWWILVEPEVEFGSSVLIPDLAGWKKDRLVPVPVGRPVTITPDWVCEVLSPSTAATDRTRKLALYGQAGVGHVWLIDPSARTLEAYRLEGGRWVIQAVHAGDERPRVEPFDAIELELGTLWSPMLPG